MSSVTDSLAHNASHKRARMHPPSEFAFDYWWIACSHLLHLLYAHTHHTSLSLSHKHTPPQAHAGTHTALHTHTPHARAHRFAFSFSQIARSNTLRLLHTRAYTHTLHHSRAHTHTTSHTSHTEWVRVRLLTDCTHTRLCGQRSHPRGAYLY
jgi:hypothetical protein